MDSGLYNWVVLPLIIFFARVADVSIGTFRIVLFSKNKKFLVTFLGFVEVMIWLLAVRQVIINLANPICYLAFAGGFAVGNYVGLVLEEKIAMGYAVIRIISRKKADDLFQYFISHGYRVTRIPAEGSTGEVDIVFTIIKRSQITRVIEIIKKYNPNAFYTIEDIKAVNESGLPEDKRKMNLRFFQK
ncbi:MAG: DUF2179 domain-containing protein [Candidatus Omnitrophica bacterium]|nr:DUF2179 domain-containing protein [Candidatus Omnitrophota bacterium]